MSRVLTLWLASTEYMVVLWDDVVEPETGRGVNGWIRLVTLRRYFEVARAVVTVVDGVAVLASRAEAVGRADALVLSQGLPAGQVAVQVVFSAMTEEVERVLVSLGASAVRLE
jgi:hypothetical protein